MGKGGEDMKKISSMLVLVILCGSLFVGCKANGKQTATTVDYSKYSFTSGSWTRDAENDIETIRFGADGSFSYSCACGNPVNDADLCEGYTYDDDTKTITLNCIEITDEIVTVITIEKCDDKELHLNFNGEIRIFTK